MNKFNRFIAPLLVILFLGSVALADQTWNLGQDRYYSPNPAAVTTVTSSYTALTTDHMIKVDASSGAVTITLPRIVSDGMNGKSAGYIIKKIDTSGNAVTVAASATDSRSNTIEGQSTRIILNYGGIMVVNLKNGYDWKVTYETPPFTTDMTTGSTTVNKERAMLRVITKPTTSQTITYSDCGKTYAVSTDALTMSLPVAVPGCYFTFINTGAAGNNILTVKANAADGFYGMLNSVLGGYVISSATGSSMVNTKTTAQPGDIISIMSTTATKWFITAGTGTWVAQ